MFEDSLVESGGRLKTRRGATTALSFMLEILLLGVLVLLPLIFTEALPDPAADDNAGRRRLLRLLRLLLPPLRS